MEQIEKNSQNIPTSNSDTNDRQLQRISLSLPIRVCGNDSGNEDWNETTQLRDVSAFGAGFALKKAVGIGRLLRLDMPLPQKLRCYDHSESDYSIWAIIRHVVLLSNQMSVYGTAFIGKQPPESYYENPETIYAVSSQSDRGLWQIDPVETNVIDKRQHERHNIPLSVVIQQFSENGELTASEQTVTENVSISGASVFSTLHAELGSFVRFSCNQYNVSIISVIRNRRMAEDGFPRLHLEFVDQRLPLEAK
jgi:PilZ domain